MGSEIIQQYGDWIEELAEWDYWTTLTFRDEFSISSARRAGEHFMKAVNPSTAWWAIENGTIGGRTHIHSLMAFGHDRPDASHIWHRWYKRHGRAEVDRFDKKRGAAHYVGKYVTKELADYDVYRARKGLFT